MRSSELMLNFLPYSIPVWTIGLLFLGIGAKVIVTRRPQIISTRWLYGPYFFLLLGIVFMQGRSTLRVWNDWYFWPLGVGFVFFVGAIGLTAIMMRKFLNRYQVIGATDESFRAAALKSFEELSIPVEQRLSHFELPSLDAKFQVLGNFRSGAAIFAIEGTADKAIIKKIVEGIRAFFRAERVNLSYKVAVVYVVMGLILILFPWSYAGAFGYLFQIISPIALFGTLLFSFSLLAVFLLFLGVKALVTRKPLLVSSWWFRGFGMVLWLFYLSLNVSLLFSEYWFEPTAVYGGLGLSLLLLFVLLFALRRQSPWNFVMGTEADTIRLGVLAFLENTGIPYEERLSGFNLPSLGAELQFQPAPGSGLGFLRVNGTMDKSKFREIVGFIKGYFATHSVGLDYQPAVLFVLFGLALLIPGVMIVTAVSSFLGLL